jgi:hypothetical protein
MKRRWLWSSLLVPILVVSVELGRVLLYSSLTPVPEDRLQRALLILAYQDVSCPNAYLFDYAEGSITLQCRDRDATRYTVYGLEPCSETLECRWFWMLCMYAWKHEPRFDTPT